MGKDHEKKDRPLEDILADIDRHIDEAGEKVGPAILSDQDRGSDIIKTYSKSDPPIGSEKKIRPESGQKKTRPITLPIDDLEQKIDLLFEQKLKNGFSKDRTSETSQAQVELDKLHDYFDRAGDKKEKTASSQRPPVPEKRFLKQELVPPEKKNIFGDPDPDFDEDFDDSDFGPGETVGADLENQADDFDDFDRADMAGLPPEKGPIRSFELEAELPEGRSLDEMVNEIELEIGATGDGENLDADVREHYSQAVRELHDNESVDNETEARDEPDFNEQAQKSIDEINRYYEQHKQAKEKRRRGISVSGLVLFSAVMLLVFGMLFLSGKDKTPGITKSGQYDPTAPAITVIGDPFKVQKKELKAAQKRMAGGDFNGVVQLEDLAEKYPGSPQAEKALLIAAATYRYNLNDKKASIRAYKKFLSRYSDYKGVDKVRKYLIELLLEENDFLEIKAQLDLLEKKAKTDADRKYVQFMRKKIRQ